MAVLCCIVAILMLTFPATVEAGKVMYFIWTCLSFCTYSGQYTLYPIAITKAFGPEHVGVIYGWSFTSQVYIFLNAICLLHFILQTLVTEIDQYTSSMPMSAYLGA